ncbi:MAG: glutathione peroxidase [Oceanospirillaceae bacterium]|nr:glutathione peroxidase [Oceanospirillaceae bacterium]MCP5350958.1 glutathione peroxidase [Oceanospirillaceae bacterium]
MDILNIAINRLDGKKLDFTQLSGKALLIVNVASECGLTPQYKKLEALYQQYKNKGLNILGLPCNQFGAQEPGSPAEIAAFCTKNYGVSFTLGEKIEVNGPGRHPLYQALIGNGADIQWNFEKFLLDGNGNVVQRFGPRTEPDDPQLITAIEQLCA